MLPTSAPRPIAYSAEIARKALHLLALVVPAGMALLGPQRALLVLLPLALLALAADVLRARTVWFAGVIDRCFGFMMRPEERPAPGSPVSINGATWVLLTATLLTFLFPLPIAVAAFASFMVADAAAALVGRRIGRHRWGAGTRTVEGSVAFLAAGMAVVALLPGVPLWAGALSVAAAAAAEIPEGPLNDNLRVPLVGATVLFGIERLFLGQAITLMP